MSMLSSDISVAESEGVPDSLHGCGSDTSFIELEGFNRLDVFDLGTINVYDETDDGDDSDYIEVSSLSIATSEDEVGMSVVSYESHFDEGSFVNRQNTQMRCDSMLMHNGGRDDSLALLSISSASTSESRIIYRPPMRNASLNPPQTSSNFVDAPGPSVSLDVHSDKEASSIESTSVEVLHVDSVDNSTENHISLRKKVKNRIRSFFKRAWMAIKCPSLCYETTVVIRNGSFVPPPDDTEPDQEQDDADSSCPAEPSGFQPNDESEEFGVWSGGFNTVNEETPPSNGKQTEDADRLDESSYSSDTSEDDCEEDVIVCGPFSILREKTVHRLGEWSFNSDLFIGEGGSDDSLYLLSISSGTSSAEEPSGAWQNGPARETCTCSCNRNMYAAGPSSMSLEAQSDSVNSVENSTEKHTSLRKKIKNGISSFFKRAWKALKCSCCYCCCCCETTVEPFVPLSEDLEPDPQPAYSKPYFVTEPSSFKPADESREFDYEMLMVESGSFGFL